MKTMKQICIFLLLIFLIGCSGTGQGKPQNGFYYPSAKLTDASIHDGLVLEARNDLADMDITQLIKEYMKGPIDPTLLYPVGSHVTLYDCLETEEGVLITFSDSLSSHPGWQSSTFCMGLAASIFHNSNVNSITIQCRSVPLNGQEQWTFSPADIEILDGITTNIVTDTIPTEVSE